MRSTYDKRPAITAPGWILTGWKSIMAHINKEVAQSGLLLVDCYPGVYDDRLMEIFSATPHQLLIDTRTLFKPEAEILQLTEKFITSDVLFGYMSNLSMADYFDTEKLNAACESLKNTDGVKLVYGYGASLLADEGILVYADMPRWEIQMRMRKREVKALGTDNSRDPISIQYKRGLFNDWPVADRHKRTIYERAHYWLDTTDQQSPKLINKETFLSALHKAANGPFRVVPFFDPAPWGGQWMKEVCDLDRSQVNYGWCFDCVPEENSLLLQINGATFEMPSVNLVYLKTTALLGAPVESRFGKEFPIRFDFLDTMGGGNLSLQVHPSAQFARENFGICYTQDESYYLLDAGADAHVYLGLKTGIDKDALLADLEKAQKEPGYLFDADKWVNKFPAKKHDHFLIPAGTIHCSGSNAMVLEISATPFIYTFKLWDWGRMGLDGKPRPVNIERGRQVLQWDRDTRFASEQLVNRFEVIASGPGWVEEKTGLHKNEFIETRRHSFTGTVLHQGNDSVHVLNLVEGDEVIVESPTNAFEPLIVHYAETFILPASVGSYSIRPHGPSQGKECRTIKAFVRF